MNKIELCFDLHGDNSCSVIQPIPSEYVLLETISQEFINAEEVSKAFNSLANTFTEQYAIKLTDICDSDRTHEIKLNKLKEELNIPNFLGEFLLTYSRFAKNNPIWVSFNIVDEDGYILKHTWNTENTYKLSTAFFLVAEETENEKSNPICTNELFNGISTGFCDINKQPIFIGDIIEFEDYGEDEYGDGYDFTNRGVVIFENGRLDLGKCLINKSGVKYDLQDMSFFPDFLGLLEHSKVLGNITNNPKLLNPSVEEEL